MRTAQASLLTVCVLLFAVAAFAQQPDGDPLSAVALAQNRVDTSEGARIWPHCAFCHTPDGLGFVRFDAPKIAGQEAWYVERQLRNFLAGRRGNHPEDIPGRQMAFNAGPLYTDPLIESMAAFLEALPVSPAKLQFFRLAALGPERPYKWDSRFAVTTAGSPASAERGKQLYATCVACHGAKAEGNRALNSPRLDNKQDWYLIRELKYFKYGARGTHPDDLYGQQMAAIMATVPNDQAIVDVVAYIMTMAKGPFTGLISSGPAAADNVANTEDNDLFEITLANPLADEPRGWCIDAAGHQVNAIMVGGAHGHTCYSYEGNGKFRVAEDQGFSMKSIKEQDRFRLVYFNHCLTVSVPKPGSWIAYTPCDSRPEQGFRLRSDGRIQSTLDPALCVTLGTRVIPGGGGSPVHQLRELLMQPCRDDLASLQQWRLRNHRDR